MRIVHYLNQFYAGLGGEDAAGIGPRILDGTVGPGRLLAQLLGSEHQIVATIVCGDNHAASNATAAQELLDMARHAGAELLVAGPAFGSGRYGLACARLAAAADAAGLPALATMHPDNPGITDAGATPVVAAGATAREMRPTLQRVAAAITKLATGTTLTAADGLVVKPARIGRLVEQRAAARAVELVLRRLAGDQQSTEVPIGGFDAVEPAAPVDKAASATGARVTEGAVVPFGNPDRLESARATRWLRYQIDEIDSLASGSWESVAGGFATTAANADPNRLVPLDAAHTGAGGRDRAAARRVHGHGRQRHGGGHRAALRRRVGRGAAQSGCTGRDPDRHLRNRNALRVNACKRTGTGGYPHRRDHQPGDDRRAGRRAAHRARTRYPLPVGRPEPLAPGRTGLAPAAGAASTRRGRHRRRAPDDLRSGRRGASRCLRPR